MNETLTPNQELEHFVDLARTLPRIDPEDPRISDYLDAVNSLNGEKMRKAPLLHGFGNNFYIIFKIYPTLDLENPGDGFASNVVALHLKALGKQWDEFVVSNPQLLQEIEDTMQKLKKAESLSNYHDKLIKSHDKERLTQLKNAINHPMGTAAYTSAAWEDLNPLLEKASKQMEAIGIDPKLLYM